MIWIAFFDGLVTESEPRKGAKLESRNFSKPSGGAMRGKSSSWMGRNANANAEEIFGAKMVHDRLHAIVSSGATT